MSRWIIIAGLAAVLVSLVALATIPGGSDQTTSEEASREPVTPETPDTPNPSTTPTTNPSTTPSPRPSTTPEAPLGRSEGQEGPGLQGETPAQGIRPSDRRASGPMPRVATIEITGDASYSCSLGRIDSPRPVRGTSPAPFQVRVTPGGSSLDTVMAVCQKTSGEELGVAIVYDGEARDQDETTDRFGTVSVSWSPVQE